MFHCIDQLLGTEYVYIQVMCILRKISIQNLNQIVLALLILMSKCIRIDGLSVGNSIQSPVIRNLGNRVQGSQKSILLCTVGWGSAWGKGGVCLTAVRCSTGSFAINYVRSNCQNRSTWLGIAVGMTAADLVKEGAQQPGCDLICTRIIITITREVALNLKILCNAFFVTDDLYFRIFNCAK